MNSRLNVSAGREFFREIAADGYETTLCVGKKREETGERERGEVQSRVYLAAKYAAERRR